MVAEMDFVDLEVRPPTDTFGGAAGEDKARAYEVYGYAFLARKPGLMQQRQPQPNKGRNRCLEKPS